MSTYDMVKIVFESQMDDYVYYEVYSKFGTFFIGVLILVLVYLKGKERYVSWITDSPYKGRWNNLDKKGKLMNYIQLGVIALSIIGWYISKYISMYMTAFISIPPRANIAQLFQRNICIVFTGIGVTFILFIVFLIICKNGRKQVVLLGLRNILMLILGVLSTLRIYETYNSSGGGYGTAVQTLTKICTYGFSVLAVFVVMAVFEVIYIFVEKKKLRKRS